MKSFRWLTLACAFTVSPLFAQTLPTAKPSFEIISIKPSDPASRQQLMVEPGGRFVANGISLGLLVAIAYHLQAYQMIGVDGWMMKNGWSIEATVPDGTVDPPSATPPYMGVSETTAARLRSLLEDRFVLKAHREIRETQAYVLTIARDGVKLKAVEAPLQAGAPGVRANGGAILSSAITMDQLTVLLNRVMDAPVVNQTGLNGYYDLQLKFDPASAPRQLGGPVPNPAGPTIDPVGSALQQSNDPSIFTALEEQLGLKLQSSKQSIDVLVIDSAQKPAEN